MLWCNVFMSITLLMAKIKSNKYLLYYIHNNLKIIKIRLTVHLVQSLTRYLFKHKIEIVTIMKILNNLNNIRMIKIFKDRGLLEGRDE